MPLDGVQLIVDPKQPFAELLAKIDADVGNTRTPQDDSGLKLRNVFHSTHRSCDIYVMEDTNGKVVHGVSSRVHGLPMQLEVLNVSDVWGIEQEARAVNTLGTLLRHRQFKQYLLTGMFMEKSERSGVHYLFRKLRPTVAFKHCKGPPWGPGRGEKVGRILATLCLHPIAFYAGSWAGAMCPTDDLLSHLMLMRGDEKLFWRRAAQHAAWEPESGL